VSLDVMRTGRNLACVAPILLFVRLASAARGAGVGGNFRLRDNFPRVSLLQPSLIVVWVREGTLEELRRRAQRGEPP